MKEKPIIFSGEMVRAILEGRKTQTRRVVKPQPVLFGNKSWDRGHWAEIADGWMHVTPQEGGTYRDNSKLVKSPYGIPGDRLYVRECFAKDVPGCPGGISYKADHQDPRGDGPANPMKWKPSIHMPKWASRLWLEVLSVRVERVGEISARDVMAEGVSPEPGSSVHQIRRDFQLLWDSINGKRPGCAWADNPFVWCVEFKKLDPEGSCQRK